VVEPAAPAEDDPDDTPTLPMLIPDWTRQSEAFEE
jgi:hypothetical protein